MNELAEKRMNAYLEQLRNRLRGMRDGDVNEIVAELRAHILEKAGAMGAFAPDVVESTLAALGTPEVLAAEYFTEQLLVRAEVSRSPWRILHGLFHWASLSLAGFAAFLGTVTGYSLGILFVLAAGAKLLHPQTAGLWRLGGGDSLEFSLRLGFGTPPSNGTELFGWWIVPLGLLLGCGLLVLTTRVAVWSARTYRIALALRGDRR